ncbi:hypothetical protein G6F68_013453 [Rhizopus microsporus]|nr:hypothetical protein G6F68_013453 [Rhizopus microsporus]
MAEHAGAAQRQAKHGAQMVLELRGLAAFDGPVPGVVHARRHLVGQQFAIAAEQLQREHAHVLQVLGNATGIADRSLPLGVGQHGRRHAGRQHAVDMPVAGNRPGLEAAIAATHGDHADLALEGHEALQDQARALDLRTQRIPSGPRRRVLRMHGRPNAAAFSASSSRLRMSAKAGSGMPSCWNRVFSLSRSWATASAAGGG